MFRSRRFTEDLVIHLHEHIVIISAIGPFLFFPPEHFLLRLLKLVNNDGYHRVGDYLPLTESLQQRDEQCAVILVLSPAFEHGV